MKLKSVTVRDTFLDPSQPPGGQRLSPKTLMSPFYDLTRLDDGCVIVRVPDANHDRAPAIERTNVLCYEALDAPPRVAKVAVVGKKSA